MVFNKKHRKSFSNFLVPPDRRGQGLSLNVIIIAALALIVLVVLIVVFTGRVGIFDRGVSEAGDDKLAAMKVSYGDCHPGAVDEAAFRTAFGVAESDAAEEEAIADFENKVNDCNALSYDKEACETGDCRWK